MLIEVSHFLSLNQDILGTEFLFPWLSTCGCKIAALPPATVLGFYQEKREEQNTKYTSYLDYIPVKVL